MLICDSFVNNFLLNPPPSMEEQGKVVRSFLEEMENAINVHPLFKDASEAELEGAVEAVEKYVMTKLYGR